MLLSVLASSTGSVAASEVHDKPNVLILWTDDLGWNDVGYHGSNIHNQNIDRIAHSGLELDLLRSAFLSSNAGGINDGSLLSA